MSTVSPDARAATWANRDDFERAVADWAEKIGVTPRQVAFRLMTRKWASCSTSGLITFSTELLGEPREFGEVVIGHELLHLVAPNHGPLFQSLLGAYLPLWREASGDRAVCGAVR